MPSYPRGIGVFEDIDLAYFIEGGKKAFRECEIEK